MIEKNISAWNLLLTSNEAAGLFNFIPLFLETDDL